jgi:hypothetical protein
MPRGRQWSGLCLAISNNDAHNEVGIVERGAKGVRDAVSQFASLMNRPGNLGRAMTPKLARKRKSAEELQQTCFKF